MHNDNRSNMEQDELKRLTNRCIAIVLTGLGLKDDREEDRPAITVIKNSIRKFEYNIRKDIMNKEQQDGTTRSRK